MLLYLILRYMYIDEVVIISVKYAHGSILHCFVVVIPPGKIGAMWSQDPHFSCLQTSNISAIYCWSLRCSWSIAWRRYSNYIFIFYLTPGFNGLSKDNFRRRRNTFKLWDLVCLILEFWLQLWLWNWGRFMITSRNTIDMFMKITR